LYDAVFFGMRYYIAKDQGGASLAGHPNLWDATSLFQVLRQANVFEDPLALNRFNLTVERALWHGPSSLEVGVILSESEQLLAKLGVLPSNQFNLRGAAVAQ